MNLFQKHCTLIKDEVAKNELLRIIDYHTLTIEILAKTAQKLHTDISVLKTAIEKDLKSPVFINHKGEKIDKVRSYLCSIFDLGKLNESEIWLMKQFVCLPSEFHTYEFLFELINPEGEHEENFSEILSELVAKGWILVNNETDGYKMHIIIKEITIQKLFLQFNDIINLIDTVTKKLKVEPILDNQTATFRWIPFGKAILSNFHEKTTQENLNLQNNLASALQTLGNYTDAKKLFENALDFCELNYGSYNDITAIVYSNLGSLLWHSGFFLDAKVLLGKAKVCFEGIFGEEHPSTISSYNELGMFLFDTGDNLTAFDFLIKVVNFNEKNFGENNHITIQSYSNIAMIYKELKNYNESERLLKKVVKFNEEYLDSNNPFVAGTYSNLGMLYISLEDDEKAKQLLFKAVHLNESNFGDEHPTTAISYSNLSIALINLEEFEQAYEYSEKALIILETKLGVEHPNTKKKVELNKLIKGNLDYAKSQIK